MSRLYDEHAAIRRDQLRSRYFAQKLHDRMRTIEELTRFDVVEPFDLDSVLFEFDHLASSGCNRDLVLALHEKLERIVDREVDEDGGQMLPGGIEAGWKASSETMMPRAAVAGGARLSPRVRSRLLR